ncbi:D-2-hydroxyacid dehydrogenase [candidate division WOR-3 bacterium]|nr:D-2-hydroxyacid dehydrogenase [candidate division WOR-3 bacterium]
MKVLICDALAKDSVDGLKGLGVEVVENTSIEKEELAGIIADFDGVIVRSRTKIRKDLIDIAAGSVKFIIRAGVGLDNIDAEYAREKGIEVINTPEASTNGVAELAVAHMLALLRHIPKATASMKEGKWPKKELKGNELGSCTVGIIGLGRIGRRTAQLVKCFGASVIGYDPYVEEVQGTDIKIVDLDELLTSSDIISLHLPHTDETHHLIGRKELGKMKNTSYLVNCARGGVIDENALYNALKGGEIRGAALDVFEEEPPTDLKLMELDNFICTPHLGAQAVESSNRVGEEVVKKVKSKL